MCIRDRLKLIRINGCSQQLQPIDNTPVSYTHLDVYKRQDLTNYSDRIALDFHQIPFILCLYQGKNERIQNRFYISLSYSIFVSNYITNPTQALPLFMGNKQFFADSAK